MSFEAVDCDESLAPIECYDRNYDVFVAHNRENQCTRPAPSTAQRRLPALQLGAGTRLVFRRDLWPPLGNHPPDRPGFHCFQSCHQCPFKRAFVSWNPPVPSTNACHFDASTANTIELRITITQNSYYSYHEYH